MGLDTLRREHLDDHKADAACPDHGGAATRLDPGSSDCANGRDGGAGHQPRHREVERFRHPLEVIGADFEELGEAAVARDAQNGGCRRALGLVAAETGRAATAGVEQIGRNAVVDLPGVHAAAERDDMPGRLMTEDVRQRRPVREAIRHVEVRPADAAACSADNDFSLTGDGRRHVRDAHRRTEAFKNRRQHGRSSQQHVVLLTNVFA